MYKKGCVLIHGFTGSPREIEIVARHLKEKGILISTPTLPGHGYPIKREEMEKYDWHDWINHAEKAVQEMSEQVEELYLVGFSMGGLISTYLATRFPVKKLVLLSASVFYMNIAYFTKDIIEGLRHQTIRDHFQRYLYKIKNTPLKAALNFRRLVKELTPYIRQIEIPTLIIQGEKDDLVDPRSAQYIYERIQSKEKHLYFLPRSKHIICLDLEKERVVELVDQFIFGHMDGGNLNHE